VNLRSSLPMYPMRVRIAVRSASARKQSIYYILPPLSDFYVLINLWPRRIQFSERERTWRVLMSTDCRSLAHAPAIVSALQSHQIVSGLQVTDWEQRPGGDCGDKRPTAIGQ
jgi:hypothetical protein